MIIIVCYNIIDYIGKAAFASKETETLDLPANGGSVSFNATVIYSSHGSCDYRQNLTLIKLKKINEITRKQLLYICRFNRGPCRPDEKSSVNLSRGDSGSEFVLTLFNVTTDSIGTYEVILESSHPHAGTFHRSFSKNFSLIGK